MIHTSKDIYLPISKLHSILSVANLLAHNNISQICYCGQISLQSAAVNCSFSDNQTPLGVTFILLAMVQGLSYIYKRDRNSSLIFIAKCDKYKSHAWPVVYTCRAIIQVKKVIFDSCSGPGTVPKITEFTAFSPAAEFTAFAADAELTAFAAAAKHHDGV